MGIYIRGVEMPKERESFTLTIKYNGLVFDTETGIQVAEAQEIPPHGRLNVIEPYMQHDEDDGFDELIKPSDIDYMHTPSVEEIIEADGLDSFIKHFED